jgi:hypothetical protein
MKRTITEAQRAFASQLPHLSDYLANEERQVLAAHEVAAKEHADRFITGHEEEALGLRDEALRELTAVRDALDDLNAEGSTGRVSARDYSARLSDLRARQEIADAQLSKAANLADTMEAVEADPIEWFSGLQERMPHMQVEVPW